MPANRQLAQAILTTARKREASFDHGKAAGLQRDGVLANLDQLYGLTIRAAAEADGVDPFLSFPVYLLLTSCWDAAVEWAELNS